MARVDYRFTLDLFREDGTPLGQAPVSVDFEPAIEWTHFDGVRSGLLPEVLNIGPATIECVWDPKLGNPYVLRVRIVLARGDGGKFCGEVPTTYLRDLAREAALKFVDQGHLRAGERFTYRVCAFGNPNDATIHSGEAFSIEEVEQRLTLEKTSLDEFSRNSRLEGKDSQYDRDMPVFIPQHVLDEVSAATREAGEMETGGVLVGKLRRDDAIPEIFLEVTAQIRAWHAEAQHTKLTFTGDTWNAVRAALALRKQNEVMLGWWHSHPDFCRNCPGERRAACDLARPFFSAEDCALQRTVFARAFNIGLLASYLGSGELAHTLFGWRRGMIESRGFHVRPAAAVTGFVEERHHGATNR